MELKRLPKMPLKALKWLTKWKRLPLWMEQAKILLQRRKPMMWLLLKQRPSKKFLLKWK